MTRGFTVERWESQIVEKEISNVVLERRVLRAKFSVSDQGGAGVLRMRIRRSSSGRSGFSAAHISS